MIPLAAAGLRGRRSRTVLAAVGVLAASLVVGTATTVGYGLATGFDRAAERADLPDVIARFDPESRESLDERVRALPNLAARSYRFERNNVRVAANGRHTHRGALHVVMGGRRGYVVTEGRDLSGAAGEVVVEQGLAREWDLEVGDRIDAGRRDRARIVGFAVSPDNVAFPLARAARVYVSERLPGAEPVNIALLWLNDPSKADVTLTQARSVSFGIGRLEFVTREGVRMLLGQAAGIVISLLVAFPLVALVAAGTMLAAGAHADVQRRLGALVVQRALGFSPARIAALQATEAALVALPAATAGIALGALAVAGPAADLLASLNELPPGPALIVPLTGALGAVAAIVVAAATWPAAASSTRTAAPRAMTGCRRRRTPTRSTSGRTTTPRATPARSRPLSGASARPGWACRGTPRSAITTCSSRARCRPPTGSRRSRPALRSSPASTRRSCRPRSTRATLLPRSTPCSPRASASAGPRPSPPTRRAGTSTPRRRSSASARPPACRPRTGSTTRSTSGRSARRRARHREPGRRLARPRHPGAGRLAARAGRRRPLDGRLRAQPARGVRRRRGRDRGARRRAARRRRDRRQPPPEHDRAPRRLLADRTSSLADFPQQARMFRLREAGGGAVLETWMVDHDGRGLAGTARELAYLDAQGGRPQGFAGRRSDRNRRLFVQPRAAMR